MGCSGQPQPLCEVHGVWLVAQHYDGERGKAPPRPSRAPGAGQPIWLGSTLRFIYLPSKFLGQGPGMRRPALVGQKYSRNAPDLSSTSARPQASGGCAGVPWLPRGARPTCRGPHGGSPWAPGPSQLCGQGSGGCLGPFWSHHRGLCALGSPGRWPCPSEPTGADFQAKPRACGRGDSCSHGRARDPFAITPCLLLALPGDAGVTAGTLRHVTAAMPRAFQSPVPALCPRRGEC